MRPRRLRPWWERVAALCLATWFLVAAVDLPALHTCAMHGADATAAAQLAMTAAMHDAAMHDAAMHDAAMHDAASHGSASHGAGSGAGHDRSPTHAGHVCSCLGACCGAALAAAPQHALVFHTRLAARPTMPGRPAHEYVAAWVDFVLPFSTAPPAGARV